MQGDKKIEKYQFSLKRVLGQGSYATVYLGKQIQKGFPVAVKVIDKKVFSNAYNVKSIQSQIDIMKKVDHENIVKLFDVYQTTNNMYIVTQLCQDGDLFRILQSRKRLPQAQAKTHLKGIMNGAKYLHKNGIIHRDLKPANILLKDKCCKISDFGFARSLDADETVMRSVVGTPLYMSPQILKKAKYTAKSDLWSVGLIYYQMLHGRTPWPANNELELINGIYHKKVVFSSDVSEKSRDFIRRCLEIDEQNRMSWQQAFDHILLQDTMKKTVKQFSLTNGLRQIDSHLDKENLNISNKQRTPKNTSAIKQKEEKQDRLGLNFRKKDISGQNVRKVQDTCLTPKGKNRLTPKNKQQNKSGLKNKSQLIQKKDTSTIKKKQFVTNNEELPKNDRFKLY